MVLITGANRGIGLALTKQYLGLGDRVIATCRRPEKAEAIKALQTEYAGRLFVEQMDVNGDGSVADAAERVAGRIAPLDILINNAGIYGEPDLNRITPLMELELQGCRDAFETNVLGVLRVTRAFLPLMKNVGGKIINITSGLGSIGEKDTPGFYAYGGSKAALNYVTRAMAEEFKEHGLIFAVINPGSVKTDMGSVNSRLSPEESSAGIIQTIAMLGEKDNSSWYSWEGKKRVW